MTGTITRTWGPWKRVQEVTYSEPMNTAFFQNDKMYFNDNLVSDSSEVQLVWISPEQFENFKTWGVWS